MVEPKDNLVKILAEAVWLKENYRIGMEEYQKSLSSIIRWAKESLCRDGKK